MPSHMVSQKLSIGVFGIKFNSLSFGLAKSRFYDILPSKHKNGRIPSHRASQKLSIGSFGSKFNSLSFGLAKSRFYDLLTLTQSNPTQSNPTKSNPLQPTQGGHISAPKCLRMFRREMLGDISAAKCAQIWVSIMPPAIQ